MKRITLLFSLLVLLSACSKDDPTDYLGNYSGEVTCVGAAPEVTTFEITLNADDTYTMKIDNEFGLLGTVEDDILTFLSQRPIGADEDAPFFTGTFRENEDGTFTFSVLLDDEGDIYSCNALMNKIS